MFDKNISLPCNHFVNCIVKTLNLFKNKALHINDIVQGCQQQDPKCQKLLYQKFAGKMLGICVRYCQNVELAKDAMQEGFVKVFKHIDSFNGKSKVDTWMTRIMINTTLNHIKKHNRYDFIDDNEKTAQMMNNQHDVAPDSITALSHAELIDMLHELPTGYRVVFNLYAIEGYNHREIGEQLGISEGTSKSQLNRARKQLQQLVIKRMEYRRSV